MSQNKLKIKINQDIAFSSFMMRANKSKSIFFPGCSLMKYGKSFIYKVFDVIKKYDSEVEICSLCCGYPSTVLDDKYKKKNEQKLVSFINKRNIDKVYVACPNCYYTLSKLKQEYNLYFSINMIYKIIDENISDIKNLNVMSYTVVIHDPCKIRNDKDTQVAVRHILDTIGQKYEETINSREKTICCGSINMTHVLKPLLAKKMCSNRVKELTKNSNIIMSYCAGCLYLFNKQKANTIHLLELIFGKQNNKSYINRVIFTLGLNKC